MKVAVLGGTGKMGGAIARHLAREHQVIIGSRSAERAKEAAGSIPGSAWGVYADAAKEADAAVFSLPYSALSEAKSFAGPLGGKLVVSVVSPMRRVDGHSEYGLEKGSAAEQLAEMLPRSRVATAFNNVPVSMMRADRVPPMDILVAADSRETFAMASELVRCVPGMRPLYAGPLSQARAVERLTPLLLNLARWNDTGSLAPRFVSEEG